MNLHDRADALTLINLTIAEKHITDRILEIRNEEAVRNNMYKNHEIQPDEHERWISRLKEATNQQFYAVLYNGDVVGGVGISSINITHRRADWAFYLSERYQGQGLGSALESKFLEYVFSRGDIDKLNCEVISWNEAVVKLHKKFGFREEGIRRNHVVRGGQSFDAIFLGIKRDEWLTCLSGAPQNKDADYYLSVIDEIQAIRSKNNNNWMDLLRLSFKLSPKEAAAIVANIYEDDGRISDLAKKLMK